MNTFYIKKENYGNFTLKYAIFIGGLIEQIMVRQTN